MLYSTISIFFYIYIGAFYKNTMVIRTNTRIRYWSQFISHKIQSVSGIKWYISNVLVQCGLITSTDEVLKCSSSESLRHYIDNEAVCIYQSCYRDTRHSSFTVKDYNRHDKLNELTGIISSYDCVRHQYNVTVKRSHDDTLPEYKCTLSPGFLEPVHLLGKEFNWSTYHLSRSSKNPASKVVQLKLPYDTREQEFTLSMTDMQPILQFRYALFEMLRRRFPRPEQASNGVSVKLLMTEVDREG
jgi:hypothetical protein